MISNVKIRDLILILLLHKLLIGKFLKLPFTKYFHEKINEIVCSLSNILDQITSFWIYIRVIHPFKIKYFIDLLNNSYIVVESLNLFINKFSKSCVLSTNVEYRSKFLSFGIPLEVIVKSTEFLYQNTPTLESVIFLLDNGFINFDVVYTLLKYLVKKFPHIKHCFTFDEDYILRMKLNDKRIKLNDLLKNSNLIDEILEIENYLLNYYLEVFDLIHKIYLKIDSDVDIDFLRNSIKPYLKSGIISIDVNNLNRYVHVVIDDVKIFNANFIINNSNSIATTIVKSGKVEFTKGKLLIIDFVVNVNPLVLSILNEYSTEDVIAKLIRLINAVSIAKELLE